MVVDLACFMKCCKYTRKFSVVIHPDLLQHPMDPGGPPSTNLSWYLTRGKINIGGMAWPRASIVQQRLTRTHLLALVTAPTCLDRLNAIIFPGFCPVVRPVSSTFYIVWFKVKPPVQVFKIGVKIFTLVRLKLLARPIEVASVFCRDRIFL